MSSSNHKNNLMKKIQNAEAMIGVIGLGYVGLPLALAYAEKNFQVLGFDVDTNKIKALKSGTSYISHIDAGNVKQVVQSGKLSATTDFSRLGEPDAIIICVPTPLTPQLDPDMSYIVKTTGQIRNCLRAGQLIVLESTTYPGTTEELVRNMLEQTGLKCGRDFYLAFSPEREDPGNKNFYTTTIPKVVGGVNKDSGDLAQTLYEKAIQQAVRVGNARTAEAVKLTENIFRAVNIAMVNELKIIYEKMDIDIWEVLDAASTKPFGFMRFNPGPGWGGHCIPLDPFYLTWKARECGIDTKFIELAGEVNRLMPGYIIGKLQQALNEKGKSIKGSKLMILGLAYKKDINDTRETPAFPIMSKLSAMGAKLSYHDPFVAELKHTRQWPESPVMKCQKLTEKTIGDKDAIIIITDHTPVDYKLVARHARLIIDSRGVYKKQMKNLVKA